MLQPPAEFCEETMRLAYEAAEAGEVPVGSVIFSCEDNSDPLHENGCRIIARNRNRITELRDPTAHSEILTIRDAARFFESERILNAYMITTLEPCLMCTGALVLARIKKVFYFTSEKKGFGFQKITEFSRSDPALRLNHYPQLVHLPEYEKRSAELLRSFFKARR